MKKLVLSIEDHQVELLLGNHNGKDHIAIKPLCEAIGIQSNNQIMKLKCNPQFSWSDIISTGTDGKRYEMTCIPVEEVGMFTCMINARRTKESVRPRLIRFQKHLQVVIHDHLTGKVSKETIESLVQEMRLLRKENEELRMKVQALGNLVEGPATTRQFQAQLKVSVLQ